MTAQSTHAPVGSPGDSDPVAEQTRVQIEAWMNAVRRALPYELVFPTTDGGDLILSLNSMTGDLAYSNDDVLTFVRGTTIATCPEHGVLVVGRWVHTPDIPWPFGQRATREITEYRLRDHGTAAATAALELVRALAAYLRDCDDLNPATLRENAAVRAALLATNAFRLPDMPEAPAYLNA